MDTSSSETTVRKLIDHLDPVPKDKSWLGLAWAVILLFTITAIMAPMLAGHEIEEESSSLIPWAPWQMDPTSISAAPSDDHLLGTDPVGRDIAAIVIYGTRTALGIGFTSILLGGLLGLVCGMMSGYYLDDRIRSTYTCLICTFIWSILFFILVHTFHRQVCHLWPERSWLSPLILVSGCLLWSIGTAVIQSNRWLRKGRATYIPIDSGWMRLIDFVQTIPALFILLIVLQIQSQPSYWTLILLIAFILWPTFVRHARAQTLRLRMTTSVMTAVGLGRSDGWIWWHLLLPQIIRPMLVVATFSCASAIMLEATLSFIGIGLPVDHTSWGQLINAARYRLDAWWLWLPPGICLWLLVWSLQRIGRFIESVLSGDHTMRYVS